MKKSKRKIDVYLPGEPVRLTRQTAAAREKALALRDQIGAALAQPLNEGGALSPSVRQAIHDRVMRARRAQTWIHEIRRS